jgi:hypothetical protein
MHFNDIYGRAIREIGHLKFSQASCEIVVVDEKRNLEVQVETARIEIQPDKREAPYYCGRLTGMGKFGIDHVRREQPGS